jgi:hypothetical protein
MQAQPEPFDALLPIVAVDLEEKTLQPLDNTFGPKVLAI